METSLNSNWPALKVADWEATRDTLQLWTQLVGKVRLALSPRENHWWGVALYVNTVGLTTSLMPYKGGGVEMVFDFYSEKLRMHTTSGKSAEMALEPRTVANFYAEFLECLTYLEIEIDIFPRPVEIADAIPFAEDTTHNSYDASAARSFHKVLVQADRVFAAFRADFTGKASPVQFYWGSFDLAASRFSGRPAPKHPGGVPNCPDEVMVEAYSDELFSYGYWPGGSEEGSFYSYAYPEPKGLKDLDVTSAGGSFNTTLGEFILPYKNVREAENPDEYLRNFLQVTFDAASQLGEWPEPTS